MMYDLMLGLSNNKVCCDMLCASAENHAPGSVKINKYSNMYIARTKWKLAATMISPSMISILRRIASNYDIIHIHHPDPMAAMALFFSRYRGRVVLHWHSDIMTQKHLLKFYEPLQNWLIKRADVIVGTSENYIDHSIPLKNVVFKTKAIPIGIEPLKANSAQVHKLKARYPDKKIIFSLGRLVPYKGYEYLIKASDYLPSNYVIVIGGKGPLESQLKKMIHTLGLENKVSMVGFIEDGDIPAYFHACDIFCLSSTQKVEAFGIVQIEAMSCGKPVVSTKIPGSGVSWVNSEGISGLIADPNDAKILAQKILQIGENPHIQRELSEGSQTRYQRLFTRDIMVDACKGIYVSLL